MHLIPTSTAAEEHERSAQVAVLPIGSHEQHGSHLPLSTDAIIAHSIATALAQHYNLMLLPTLPVGTSQEHIGLLRGTISIRATTLYTLVNDIADSLEQEGIDQLVIVNGHGGNHVLSNVVVEASAHPSRRMVLFPTREAWKQARDDARCKLNDHDDMHGGEAETSILLHVASDLVREGWREADHDASYRPHFLLTGMRGYTTTGIIGAPSEASADKGKALIESFVQHFAPTLACLTRAPIRALPRE